MKTSIFYAAVVASMLLMALTTYAQTAVITNPGTASESSQSVNVGYTFQVTANEPLSALGIYDGGNGLVQSHEVGIFNSSGVEIADAIVPATSAGSGDSTGFVYTTAITYMNGFTGTLAANTDYTIGAVYYSGGDPFRYDNGASLATSSQVVLVSSEYNMNTYFSLPNIEDDVDTAYVGPNFQFGTGSPAQTPAITNPGTASESNQSVNVGYTFQVTANEPLSALGIYDGGNGLVQSHEVGIFNSSGVEIADATVPATSAGSGDSTGFVYTTAITYMNGFTGTLAANTYYTIGAVYYSGGDPFRYDNGASLATSSQVVLVSSEYNMNTYFSLPNIEDDLSTAYVGPNFQFGAGGGGDGLSSNAIGIGVTGDGPGDWLWADAIREARPQWATAADPWADPGTATVDSNNWPTEDCSLVVWEGHAYNDGTYALSFNGKATISDALHYCTVLPSSTGTYNAATNTTTATLVITDTGSENFSLVLTNTQRTADSATNTGVTNVHLYRPISEGSSSSYSAGTLFTNQTLAMSASFSVSRYMWTVSVIGSTETNWSDRPLPGAWNQQVMAYEYTVAYSNATNTDLYMNIPLYATDTYITNLANLIKYGSDGVNPYTSVQSNPVYPPLNSNLHVYLEYSNEVWNGGYAETSQNYNIVAADQTANNAEWAILNYDGQASASDLWNGAWRRIALRAVAISNDFRAVYGNSAMPPNANAIVRPLFEFQAGNGQDMGLTGLGFVDTYYNNSDGVSHVTTPYPVNYFLWGGGGATYYNSNDDTAATTDALFDSGIPGTGYPSMVQADAAAVKAYGMKRVAYEGGFSVYNGTNGYENIAGTAAASAKYDSRAATAEENAETIFQQSGGDLNIYLLGSDWDPNEVWAMTDEIFNLNTPLFTAMSSITHTTPAAITFGNSIAGSGTTTLAYGSQLFSQNVYSQPMTDNGVLGWVPLISTAGNYQISVNINSTTSGKYMKVLVDGGQTLNSGVINVPVSSSPVNVVLGTVNLTAGQHGLLVEGQYASNNSYTANNSGTFTNVVFTKEP